MKKIDKIKNGLMARQWFAAKVAARMIPEALGIEQKSPTEILSKIIGKNSAKFLDEIHRMKGPAMKAAQLLTIYGEYYLPKELNHLLKEVQSQSYFLDFDQLKNSIPQRITQQFEIDPIPLASASIGQVHKGVNRSNGEICALKIQFPNINKAIDVDLFILKQALSLSKIFPKSINLDRIFIEIKEKLILEMDYFHEAKVHQEYRDLVKDFSGIYVPKVYSEYSTQNVLVTEFTAGKSLSEDNLSLLPQELKNQMGATIFKLFLHELFVMGIVQSDAHAGNYLYSADGEKAGTVICIDFGATVRYSEKVLSPYRKMITGLFHNNRTEFDHNFDVIMNDSNTQFIVDRNTFYEYCRLCASPLHSTYFDWETTTLPDDIYKMGQKMIKEIEINQPPHEYIFIDRKIAGIFSLLRLLKAKFNVAEIARVYLK